LADFKVGDHNYRCGKMSARVQFHVARKLGPILAKLGPGVTDTRSKDENKPFNMIDLLEPAVDALAEMPENDCDYVLDRCMAVVQRQVGTAWQNIWNESAKKLIFENDIDLSAMIQIAVHVLGDNLGNFIGAPVSTTSLPPQPGLNTHLKDSLVSPMGKTGF
jgi:hypothetical protein